MRKFFLILAGVLGLLTLAGVMIAGPFVATLAPWTQGSGSRPSDAAMIAHWHRHRATFERLAAMMAEDARLTRVGEDFVTPEAGLDAERRALYRQLMREAGIRSINHYGPQIEFVYFTQGIAVSGGAKSFCFGRPADFAEQIDGDLDAARAARRSGYTLQRRIEGDWWLQADGT
ncbi:hypothetical protein MXD81_39715 [Microbacteriaceae bacterium K1510]|nr:hypothetical protein [Microbacteriaceae bacterium K1510]